MSLGDQLLKLPDVFHFGVMVGFVAILPCPLKDELFLIV